MSEWQDISTAPEGTRIMIWCADASEGYKFGSVKRYSDGELHVNAEGMSGPWTYTHWQPLPSPPEQ